MEVKGRAERSRRSLFRRRAYERNEEQRKRGALQEGKGRKAKHIKKERDPESALVQEERGRAGGRTADRRAKTKRITKRKIGREAGKKSG
jgi:hypothetical protein